MFRKAAVCATDHHTLLKAVCSNTSDHGFIHSIYFRDPNGYVVELTAKTDPDDNGLRDSARANLDSWQESKTAT